MDVYTVNERIDGETTLFQGKHEVDIDHTYVKSQLRGGSAGK